MTVGAELELEVELHEELSIVATAPAVEVVLEDALYDADAEIMGGSGAILILGRYGFKTSLILLA